MYPAINREKSLLSDLLPTCSTLFGFKLCTVAIFHIGNRTFFAFADAFFPFGKHGVDFFAPAILRSDPWRIHGSYPLVMTNVAMENGHRNSEFSH